MYESIKSVLLDLLKAPHEPPDAPRGTHGSVQIFRASPKFLQYQYIIMAISMSVLGFIFLVIGAVVLFNEPLIGSLLLLLFFLIWSLITIVGYVTIRLEYELRYYVLTDRSLRIRRGVWSILEQTLTYANVQNIKVEQGPIERALGLSNLAVETAGGGASQDPQHGGGYNYHQAALRGLDNAEEIKQQMMHYLRTLPQYSGLGDLDEHVPKSRGFSAAEIAMLKEILQELRTKNSGQSPIQPIA
jgi:membrane protein YdbS with pleckstrin-like domain